MYVAPDGKTAAMIEVNCETDFVSRNDEFKAFANEVAQVIAATIRPTSQRSARPSSPAAKRSRRSGSRWCRRSARTSRCGASCAARPRGTLASYVHGVKIGVLVDVPGGDATLGKDLAMHIAASKPLAIDRSGVAAETVERERAIAAARAAESGKPANIVDKMVEGAVAKFLADVTLLAQAFVKGDGKQTVADLAKSQGATVNGFTLYVVGEGIEKKKDDFAAEVAAMSKA